MSRPAHHDAAMHEDTSTYTFAKLGPAELAALFYGTIGEHIKRNVVRLNRGEVVMTHSTFRHPIRITFPRGPFKKSRQQV